LALGRGVDGLFWLAAHLSEHLALGIKRVRQLHFVFQFIAGNRLGIGLGRRENDNTMSNTAI
jgi:hypothetical protein